MLLLNLIVIGISLASGDRYRLPKNVIPLRYDLTMEPLLFRTNNKVPQFQGRVVIEIEVLNTTSTITLHAENLDITSTSLTLRNSDGKNIALRRTSSDKETSTYTLQLRDQVVKGKRYNITFGEFRGELNTGYGFYVGLYYVNNTERLMAGTHFQPKGARRAFPCFDEPHFKARFAVSLIRTEEYYSLSNQELLRTEKISKNRFLDIFDETPLMSTYIVAFAILNFDATQKLERHRAYALRDIINSVEKSLTAAVSLLRWFEDYTRIPYPLPKMDHLIVPSSFIKDRAMENWGLIVYREHNFKYSDEPRTSKKVLEFQAHEIAHQWFGNLVTPENFDYLWLSESITTYVKTLAAASVQPTFRLVDQFLIDNVQLAFTLEEIKGAYSLNYYLQDDEMFPPFHILYEKGSSILRMMTHFLSPEVFQQALSRFLHKNQYKSVVPFDFYKECQEALGETPTGNYLQGMNVAEIMGTWDSNPGYPIITVTRNYHIGLVTITQYSTDQSTQQLWKIPISYVHSTNPNFENTFPQFWLTKQTGTIPDVSADGWLIVNTQQTGHYRVNYDLENWKRIITFLHNEDNEKIHVLNRAQLVNDAFYFAYTKKIPVSIPLTLCEYLTREKDYIVFASFFHSVSYYLGIYSGVPSEQENEYFSNLTLGADVPSSKPNDYTREYKIFQKYIRNIMTNVRNALGDNVRPQDTFTEKLFRTEINRYFPYYF